MPKSVNDPQSQADWIAAVGERTRLAIIRHLAAGEMTVTEIAKACRTEMVNVSHHLGVLRAAGLVEANRDGRFIGYSLVGAKVARGVLELAHESGAKVIIPLS